MAFSASSTRILKVHDAAGRVVAGVRADGTLQKDIAGSRHMLRQPCRAIAFDLAALAEAERAGAVRIEIRDLDTGKLYTANLNEFRALGFAVNRGFGEQWALALERWHTGADPDARQLGFWGARGN